MKKLLYLAYLIYFLFTVMFFIALYFEITSTGPHNIYIKLLICVIELALLFGGCALMLCAQRDEEKRSDAIKLSIIAALCVYLVFFFNILFFEGRLGGAFRNWNAVDFKEYFRASTNFIPFKTIAGYFRSLDYFNNYGVRFLIGNILVFTPFGFFMPMLFEGQKRFVNFLVFAVCFIIICETSQVILLVGSGDIDDLLLNLPGALAAHYLTGRLRPLRRLRERIVMGSLY